MRKQTIGSLALVLLTLTGGSTIFAAETTEVPVNGEVGIQDITDPDVATYDLTIATSAEWFVTEHSGSSIWNTSAALNTTNPNIIQNDNQKNISYKVKLDSFTQGNEAAEDLESYLTLNLTGSLAEDGVGIVDLSEGTFAGQDYTARLQPGESKAWNFGFSGSYTQGVTSTVLTPTYKLALEFDI